MILTKNIYLKNFKDKKKSKKLSINLNKIINKKNEILNSLSLNYKYSYSKNFIKKFHIANDYFNFKLNLTTI